MDIKLAITFDEQIKTPIDDVLKALEPCWNPVVTRTVKTTLVNVPDDITLTDYDELIAIVRKGFEEKYTNVTIERTL